jgi:hypothetical protein
VSLPAPLKRRKRGCANGGPFADFVTNDLTRRVPQMRRQRRERAF